MEGQERDRWRQFCIQYAKSVAFKFAQSWQQYTASMDMGQEAVPVSDVINQITQTLSKELSERLTTPEHLRPLLAPPNTLLSSVLKTNVLPGSATNFRERSCGWRSLNEYGRPASIADVSWLSRSHSEVVARESSMMGDSMTTTHQQQQHPTPSNVPRCSSKRFSWFRSHFPAKTAVELVKEGHVRYMCGSELETKQWRKCRLCLVKTAGGHLLEFYSPPKSSRAKSGIFCFLIMEVRETTPLEFEEGNDSIFAIRGYNDIEYVIEARNIEECQQWLSAIRNCVLMSDPSNSRRFLRQPSAPPVGSNFIRSRQIMSTRSLNNIHALASSSALDARIPFLMRGLPPGLETYPWFHARLSRSVSARLVLHNGADGHGLFLVRQSETRSGEFVLTFNCQGKAKHVRVVVMPDGECRIHQMIFESMIDLLEHFRDNPMPLENTSCSPMLLNEYVICWRRRSLTSDLDVRDFLTYAGSVRLDIRALEQLVRHEQQERHLRGQSTQLSNSYRLI